MSAAGRGLASVVVAALLCLPARAGAEEGTAAIRTHGDRVTTVASLAQQVFGPLPAVASTPFLGLAALSGVGLLTDTSLVRETRWSWLATLRDNALVAEARRYSTWPRFLALAGLALLGYLANSGKLQGVAGKAFRLFEDSSVLVGYTLLAVASLPDGSPGPPRVAEAGILGSLAPYLLPLATALALGTMMAVRFAFDVLIWLSPVPFVDLLFETSKKVVTLGVLLLYLWSPALAAALCLVALLVALLAAGWAFRVLGLYRRVLLNPLLAALVPGFFPRLVDAGEARRCGLDPAKARLAAPAVALALPGLPKRTAGLLVAREGAAPSFEVPGSRWPGILRGLGRGRPRSLALAEPGGRLRIGRTLLWLEVRVVDASGRLRARLALSRALEPSFETIRAALGADDLGSLGARDLIELAGEAAGRGLSAAEDALRR